MRLNNTPRVFLTVLLLAGLLGAAARLQSREETRPVPDGTPVPGVTETPVSPYAGKLVITELMEKNKSVLADEDGDFSDWIELYNASDAELDLTGFYIADSPTDRPWAFPETRLPAGGRLLVFASNKDRRGDALHTSFGLSEGELVCLWDSRGLPVSSAETGGCTGDVSMALDAEGGWAPCLYPTPGEENSRAGYVRCQQTQWSGGPLVINEAAVANFGLYYTGYRSDSDWVEIKNVSGGPVDLGEYYLSDDSENLQRWRLPEMALPAGAMLVVACDDDPKTIVGTPCTGFGLGSAEEQLFLSRADGTLSDRASLRAIPVNGSYGRLEGEEGFFYFSEPTPERENVGGARFISDMPASPTRDGIYEKVKQVQVELAGPGEIYYTLDGSLPTAESNLYTEPITLKKTCVVRAVSLEEGCLPSPPLNLSFILNEGHSLPVAGLVSDSPRDFNLMYDGGHKNIEQPGALSVYLDDGSFTIGCGISMNGETSLVENKKNMALRFRGAYGQEQLHFDLFGGGVTDFTNLLLRAGQDQNQAVIRNELAQALCDRAGCKVINQRSRYCVLYVNGAYTGLYTLMEKANEQLYASVTGVTRDSVELVEAPAPYQSDFFNEVVAFPFYNDITKPENYEKFCRAVDIDSFIDWTFMEGFCSNTDVTMGNVRYARSDEADGKWHFLFYDLDAAFRFGGSIYYNLMSEYSLQHVQISSAIVPLMQNQQFKDRFLRRASELLSGPLTNEAVLEEIDRLAAEIEPEIARDRKFRLGWEKETWDGNMRQLRELVRDEDWRQMNIDALCDLFELTKAERAKYFGEIDGRGTGGETP